MSRPHLGHPTLDVIVLANGQSLGRWAFTAWTASGLAWDAAETEEVEIPAPVVAGSPDLLVQFTVVNPRSPMSMNLTPESRLFGCISAGCGLARPMSGNGPPRMGLRGLVENVGTPQAPRDEAECIAGLGKASAAAKCW